MRCPYCNNKIEVKEIISPIKRAKKAIRYIESNIGKIIPIVTLRDILKNIDNEVFDSTISLLIHSGYVSVPRNGFLRRVL